MNQISHAFEAFAPAGLDMELDPGIRDAVLILRSGGIETFESCQGGDGHASPEPMVRFHGSMWAGYRAFAVAMEHGLPVLSVSLEWAENDGQLAGPSWKMVFRPSR